MSNLQKLLLVAEAIVFLPATLFIWFWLSWWYSWSNETSAIWWIASLLGISLMLWIMISTFKSIKSKTKIKKSFLTNEKDFSSKTLFWIILRFISYGIIIIWAIPLIVALFIIGETIIDGSVLNSLRSIDLLTAALWGSFFISYILSIKVVFFPKN